MYCGERSEQEIGTGNEKEKRREKGRRGKKT